MNIFPHIEDSCLLLPSEDTSSVLGWIPYLMVVLKDTGSAHSLSPRSLASPHTSCITLTNLHIYILFCFVSHAISDCPEDASYEERVSAYVFIGDSAIYYQRWFVFLPESSRPEMNTDNLLRASLTLFSFIGIVYFVCVFCAYSESESSVLWAPCVGVALASIIVVVTANVCIVLWFQPVMLLVTFESRCWLLCS